MNTTELLRYHISISEDCRKVMEAKNHDYSGASGETPFANFESTELLGITSVENGILIRMVDKIKRLITFVNAGELKVKDETYEDACKDIINYSILLAAFIRYQKKKETTK